MAYETYTTEAIVCGTYERGEHDVTLRLYTKDAGMIYARAGGVRAGQSKLRYALQDFSYAYVTLVRGRHEWRVTGAICIENIYYNATSRAGRTSVLTSMRALRRLVQGEGAHAELFAVVIDGLRTLTHEMYAQVGSQIFLLRLLHHLGYIAPRAPYETLVHADTLARACGASEGLEGLEALVDSAVERALEVSHL